MQSYSVRKITLGFEIFWHAAKENGWLATMTVRLYGNCIPAIPLLQLLALITWHRGMREDVNFQRF